MLEAIARAASEKGYARTSVTDIVTRAGVSRETFYEHFDDKADCFMAAFDAGVEMLLAAMRAAPADDDAPPIERLDRALGAYLDLIASQPDFARTFLIEVYAVGPEAVARRAELQQRFVQMVSELLELDDEPPGSPEAFACEAIVAATSSLVTSAVGADRAEELAGLKDPIIGLVGQLLEQRPPSRRRRARA